MNSTTLTSETIELTPRYNLPIFIIILGVALSLVQMFVGIITILFGFFLLIQANIIKLKFTPKSLEVYRQQNKIREFPYTDWQNWAIFWQPVPILFYFKEVKSIHFLPIIFDPITLKKCLEKYYPLP
ncbi:DUF3119 family protein [Cyanobacterium aponinum FACHB-4101]|uniref:DUF3119 family protein n=1 Tax=Cyanobacterium aponinum TaxID=379064 RepID=UPI0016815934|nr:DUF3119 family protein [Cyanobacterium aponinum FACHB-4101]